MILFGIKNCDTVRKARKWLEANQTEFTFHDFREQGLERAHIEAWLTQVSWEALFNKRSTSFRNLSEDEKQNIDETKAVDLMLTHPTLIKRPVLVTDSQTLVGFKAPTYEEALS